MGNVPLLPHISGFSTLLPVLLSFIFLRGNGPGKKQILLYWILAACSEFVGFITAINGINNHWFLLVFNFFEFPLIANIFMCWEPNKKIVNGYKWGIFSYAIIYLAVVATLLNLGFLPMKISTFIRPAGSLLVCFLAMRLFYKIFSALDVIPHKDFRFYFAASILIYFASGAVIFAIPLVGLEISDLWRGHAIFNIIHNVLFVVVIFFFRYYPVASLKQQDSIIWPQ